MTEEAIVKMTIDEALAFSDEWVRGMTLHEGSQGWRIVCMILADEVRRFRQEDAIQELVDQAQEFDMGYGKSVLMQVGISIPTGKDGCIAYINVEKRCLEWACNPWDITWNVPITVDVPRIPLYDRAQESKEK